MDKRQGNCVNGLRSIVFCFVFFKNCISRKENSYSKQMLYPSNMGQAQYTVMNFKIGQDLTQNKAENDTFILSDCSISIAVLQSVSLYHCFYIRLIKGFWFLSLPANQTGRTSGWEFGEENDSDLWEKVLQKSGTENKVSRQSRKVRLFPVFSLYVINLNKQNIMQMNAKKTI